MFAKAKKAMGTGRALIIGAVSTVTTALAEDTTFTTLGDVFTKTIMNFVSPLQDIAKAGAVVAVIFASCMLIFGGQRAGELAKNRLFLIFIGLALVFLAAPLVNSFIGSILA